MKYQIPKTTINCNGKLIDLEQPLVMGILNVTPDSFFDGGKYIYEKEIIERANQIIGEGGKIIDIGAFSTRPNAVEVSEEEEWKRLQLALNLINKEFPNAIISLDTYRSNIAKKAVEKYGVSIINDISGGNFDENMFKTVAELKVPYVLMHIKGTPQTMQKNPIYKDVISEISLYFSKKVEELKLLGVSDIILDPGFGFGKTIEHNYTILKNLKDFSIFNLPILAGVSRKSMIFKYLNIKPQEALNGTTVLNTFALERGAKILRVHDVKQAVETVKLTTKFTNS